MPVVTPSVPPRPRPSTEAVSPMLALVFCSATDTPMAPPTPAVPPTAPLPTSRSSSSASLATPPTLPSARTSAPLAIVARVLPVSTNAPTDPATPASPPAAKPATREKPVSALVACTTTSPLDLTTALLSIVAVVVLVRTLASTPAPTPVPPPAPIVPARSTTRLVSSAATCTPLGRMIVPTLAPWPIVALVVSTMTEDAIATATPTLPPPAPETTSSLTVSFALAVTITAPVASTVAASPIPALIVSVSTPTAAAPPTPLLPPMAMTPPTLMRRVASAAVTDTSPAVALMVALAPILASASSNWISGVATPAMALGPAAAPATPTLISFSASWADTETDPASTVVAEPEFESIVAVALFLTVVEMATPPIPLLPPTAMPPARLRALIELVAATLTAPDDVSELPAPV